MVIGSVTRASEALAWGAGSRTSAAVTAGPEVCCSLRQQTGHVSARTQGSPGHAAGHLQPPMQGKTAALCMPTLGATPVWDLMVWQQKLFAAWDHLTVVGICGLRTCKIVSHQQARLPAAVSPGCWSQRQDQAGWGLRRSVPPGLVLLQWTSWAAQTYTGNTAASELYADDVIACCTSLTT